MKSKMIIVLIMAIAFAGCKTETPESDPKANFTYAKSDLQVTFTNQSLNAQRYYWDFGDGSATTDKNPVKTYKKDGVYKVTLKATNITKSDICEKEIVVSSAAPKAQFSYSKSELTVKFTNQSSNANSYYWDFGNGKTSTENDPTITYAQDGTYSVSLTAQKGDLQDTYTQRISVEANAPKASFSYKTLHPLKVVLTNTSSGAVSYQWDFGDGHSSTEKSPTHRYKSKGVYTITLTAKGSKSSTYSETITIEEPTKCYLSGYVISKVPKQNEYYRIRFTDQYLFTPDDFGTTDWILLSNANLPHTFTFSSPKQVTGFANYWCTLWQSSKSNGSNASNAFRFSISQNQLFTDFPETLINSDQSSAKIEIQFSWK